MFTSLITSPNGSLRSLRVSQLAEGQFAGIGEDRQHSPIGEHFVQDHSIGVVVVDHQHARPANDHDTSILLFFGSIRGMLENHLELELAAGVQPRLKP